MDSLINISKFKLGQSHFFLSYTEPTKQKADLVILILALGPPTFIYLYILYCIIMFADQKFNEQC
jgi:hypothetical protein